MCRSIGTFRAKIEITVRFSRLLPIFLLALPLRAEPVLTHSAIWFMYFGDHYWNEHWGLHLEGQLRRVDTISKPQQLLLRPGLDYRLNRNLSFMVGYTNFQNYSYDPLSSRRRVVVHSIHEEATVSHGLGKLNFRHRFRLEQRFSENGGKLSYGNRVRYRFSADVPLSKRNYVALYDEVFTYFGAHTVSSFDQNRTYGALGFKLGKPGNVEFGYLHQYQTAGAGFRHVHAIQVGFYSKLPLHIR